MPLVLPLPLLLLRLLLLLLPFSNCRGGPEPWTELAAGETSNDDEAEGAAAECRPTHPRASQEALLPPELNGPVDNAPVLDAGEGRAEPAETAAAEGAIGTIMGACRFTGGSGGGGGRGAYGASALDAVTDGDGELEEAGRDGRFEALSDPR